MKFLKYLFLGLILISCSEKKEIDLGDFVYSVQNSIVFISASGNLEKTMEYESLEGTGFVITEDGYIATAGHIFTEFVGAFPDNIFVDFLDSEPIPAELRFLSEKEDIAFLKVDREKPIRPLTLEEKIPKYGDPVIIIGYYYSTITFSTGAFYTYKINEEEDPKNIDYFSRYDPHMAYVSFCFFARGQSGSPIFNINGKVIGLNILFFGGTGHGGKTFSVPPSTIINLFKKFIRIDI